MRASVALSPDCTWAWIAALETAEFSPKSQLTGSASAAFFARHQLSATTATASVSFTTRWTPLTPASLLSSTDLSVPLNTGHCTIAACNIFGSRTSMA
jgi:hypothetical protein